jgi:hypothetical protein
MIGKEWVFSTPGFVFLTISFVYLLSIIFLPVALIGTVIFPHVDYPIFCLIFYLILFTYSLVTYSRRLCKALKRRLLRNRSTLQSS